MWQRDRLGELVLSLAAKGESEEIGGKARNLMDLMAAGFPVPEGRVVSTSAYERFLDWNGLRQRISDALKDLDYRDAMKVVRSAESVRGWMMAGEMDPELTERSLKDTAPFGPSGLWAVRSSAMARTWSGPLSPGSRTPT